MKDFISLYSNRFILSLIFLLNPFYIVSVADVEQEPDCNVTQAQQDDFLRKITVNKEQSLIWNLRNYKPLFEKHIVVIIPSYCNSKRYKKNLDSIFMQKYENYHIIYIDDASDDNTGDLVAQYAEQKGQSHRVTLIKNTQRCYSLANIYKAVYLCDDDDIIAMCDGDDWWCSEYVLETLNKVYQKYDNWLTYGDLIRVPKNLVAHQKPVALDIIQKNDFRNYPWNYSGLRTYYAWLFKKINKEDLLFNGEFIKSHCDGAYFYPLLEMAGLRQQFIPDIFYVAYRATGINNFLVNAELQKQMQNYIHIKPKYKPLANRE